MNNIKMIVCAVVVMMFGAGFMPVKKAPAPVKAAAPAVFRDYVWYLDEDYNNPTGTVSDIDAEMDRLRAMYPLNVFTATPSMTVSEYEWGYYPYTFPAIIYSNM